MQLIYVTRHYRVVGGGDELVAAAEKLYKALLDPVDRMVENLIRKTDGM